MKGSNNQAWVTTVTCDEDVQKALVLCSSLRRVYTSRKIAVLVSATVAEDLRDVLHLKFDLVFDIEHRKNLAEIDQENFAKIYCLAAMRSFEKCAYLSPLSIVLQNCDEIFQSKFNVDFVLPENNNLSVFLFRPSQNNFSALMSALCQNGKKQQAVISSHIRQLLLNHNKHNVSFLDKQYTVEMSPGKHLLNFEQELGIIHFSKACYPTDEPEMIENFELEFGLLGKRIGMYFKEMLEMDVKPLMESKMDKLASIEDISFHEKEPIAIIGTSLRLPLSNNINEFWEILINGVDAVRKPTSKRGEAFLKEFSSYNAGFLTSPVDQVDAKFFGMSPNDALAIDPQIRLLHEVVWEALEDSGIDPLSLRNTSGGIFVGSWQSEYKELLASSNDVGGFRQYMGSDLSTSAARLAFFLGLVGPCMSG